jgi:hypothetical protein
LLMPQKHPKTTCSESDQESLTRRALVVGLRPLDEEHSSQDVLPVHAHQPQVRLRSLGLDAAESDLSVLVCPDDPLHPCIVKDRSISPP